MVVTRGKSKSVANVTTNPGDRAEHSATSHRNPVQLVPCESGAPQRDSRDTHSSRRSHTASSTVLAQKLAVEAEIQRRRADREKELIERERIRERELARIQQEADEMELRAKLASLDARTDKYSSRSSSHSHRHRVATWVENQHVTDIPLDPRSYVAPHIEPPAMGIPISTPADNTHAPTNNIQAPVNNTEADPISQLTKAICTLPNHHKRLELTPFSGNINDWLAFKCTYERTKASFTPTENIARLVAAIRGDARVAVMSVLFETEDPDEVITALERNYARPELVVAQEIAGLRNIKISNVEHLNTLANKLRNCVATIKWLK